MKLSLNPILLTVVLLFGIMNIRAAEPIRWGVVGGMNLSRIKADTDFRFGYHTGVKAELPLPMNLYLESALMYTRKGFSYELNNIGPIGGYGGEYYTSQRIRSNKNMLELPVHIGYKLAVHEKVKLFVSTGLYFGYGLSGKMKGKEVITSYTDLSYGGVLIEDVKPSEVKGFQADVYNIEKRFDWGLGLKAGVEVFDRIQLSASYDWGMNKLHKSYKDMKNRNLMFSLAFMFN